MDNFPDILAILTSFIVGVIGPVLVHRVQSRQARTEKAQRQNEVKLAEVSATQKATDNLIEQLQEEIARLHRENQILRADLERYRHDNIEYRIGTDQLIGQVEQLGDEPRWRPQIRKPGSIDDYLPKRDQK